MKSVKVFFSVILLMICFGLLWNAWQFLFGKPMGIPPTDEMALGMAFIAVFNQIKEDMS